MVARKRTKLASNAAKAGATRESAELKIAKEELQLVNEELSTVNNQLHDRVSDLETAHNDLANFLNCTDIAAVFLDPKFCIRRFTPAAASLFNLIATDVGRPISDIGKRFADDDLLNDARQFLHDLKPREKEVRLDDGRWWARRIISYRTLDNRIDGVVFTFMEISERKRIEEELQEREKRLADDLASMIRLQHVSTQLVQTEERAALLREILDAAIAATGADKGNIQLFDRRSGTLRIVASCGFDKPFLDFFNAVHEGAVACGTALQSRERVVIEDVTISPVFVGSPELDVLRSAGVRGVQSTPLVSRVGQIVGMLSTHYSTPRRPADRDLRIIDLLARQAADWSERTRDEDELRDRESRLRAILETASDAIVTIDSRGIIKSVNPATESIFRYSAAEMVGQNVKMLMPNPYRDEHDAFLARYQNTGDRRIIGIGREVQGRRKNGDIFPVDLAVSEVEPRTLFVGMVRDITRRKQLEHEVLEIATLEQRRIGQELHDDIGQHLTGLTMLAEALAQKLSDGGAPHNGAADQLAAGLCRLRQQLQKFSRGLVLADVNRAGLRTALAELAARTFEQAGVNCTLDAPDDIVLDSEITATHLFRIAQEAVNNALRHAQAKNIQIRLYRQDHSVILSIGDDGIGMGQKPDASKGGVGIKLMRNRASIVYGRLEIGHAPGGGTLVACTLPQGFRYDKGER